MMKNKKITYSRLTNGFDSVLKNKEDVIRKYNMANINSFLGPNVDFNNIDSNYKSKIDTLLILSKKYSFIPCLKHFCYDYEKGNTHFSESINYKSYKKILSEDLKPYYYLSSVIDKNYLIMVGHHKIKEIDSVNVASQSEKINLLISKELKNSVTISDEIGMRASSKGNIYFRAFPNYSFIKNIKTDILLAQGGNIFDHRELILKEISKLNKDTINLRCLKILKLKKEYNLIETIYVK
jgi:beta-glucosidase-like glycosyl hydrolase